MTFQSTIASIKNIRKQRQLELELVELDKQWHVELKVIANERLGVLKELCRINQDMREVDHFRDSLRGRDVSRFADKAQGRLQQDREFKQIVHKFDFKPDPVEKMHLDLPLLREEEGGGEGDWGGGGGGRPQQGGEDIAKVLTSKDLYMQRVHLQKSTFDQRVAERRSRRRAFVDKAVIKPKKKFQRDRNGFIRQSHAATGGGGGMMAQYGAMVQLSEGSSSGKSGNSVVGGGGGGGEQVSSLQHDLEVIDREYFDGEEEEEEDDGPSRSYGAFKSPSLPALNSLQNHHLLSNNNNNNNNNNRNNYHHSSQHHHSPTNSTNNNNNMRKIDSLQVHRHRRHPSLSNRNSASMDYLPVIRGSRGQLGWFTSPNQRAAEDIVNAMPDRSDRRRRRRRAPPETIHTDHHDHATTDPQGHVEGEGGLSPERARRDKVAAAAAEEESSSGRRRGGRKANSSDSAAERDVRTTTDGNASAAEEANHSGHRRGRKAESSEQRDVRIAEEANHSGHRKGKTAGATEQDVRTTKRDARSDSGKTDSDVTTGDRAAAAEAANPSGRRKSLKAKAAANEEESKRSGRRRSEAEGSHNSGTERSQAAQDGASAVLMKSGKKKKKNKELEASNEKRDRLESGDLENERTHLTTTGEDQPSFDPEADRNTEEEEEEEGTAEPINAEDPGLTKPGSELTSAGPGIRDKNRQANGDSSTPTTAHQPNAATSNSQLTNAGPGFRISKKSTAEARIHHNAHPEKSDQRFSSSSGLTSAGPGIHNRTAKNEDEESINRDHSDHQGSPGIVHWEDGEPDGAVSGSGANVSAVHGQVSPQTGLPLGLATISED